MSDYAYGRRVAQGKVGHEADLEDPSLADDFNELEVAEYVVFLFALDTYLRYLHESTGSDQATDHVAEMGMRLVRYIESRHVEALKQFFDSHLLNATHRRMVERGFSFRPNGIGVARRALQLRTALSLGGTTTMRAVFKNQKALLAVRTAISAATVDDADAALDKFAVIMLRNVRLRGWIDLAAKTAGSGAPPDPVSVATDGVGKTSQAVVEQNITAAGQSVSSQMGADAATARDETLLQVREEAEAKAQRSLAQGQQADDPPRRSEVVAIATAAAVAATSDPENPRNVPPALAHLSDENRAVAVMGGRVRVSAGAGSGKSTTLIARVAYLVKEKGVAPERILVTSFNKKAADELKAKIAKAVGQEAASRMTVGTMHGTFLSFINKFGTPEEKAMFVGPSYDRSTGQRKDGTRVIKDGQVMRPILKVWDKCFPQPDPKALPPIPDFPPTQLWKYTPKPRRMRAYMNKFQGQGWSLAEVQDWARKSREQEHIQAAVFFEFYEGFKGTLGTKWSPRACPTITQSKEYATFATNVKTGKARVGDFADMLTVFRNITRNNPQAKKALQGQYDHVFVDECQDLNQVQNSAFMALTEHIQTDDPQKGVWMVGDANQCVDVDTPISTPTGQRRAGDLRAGDQVLAYRNGEIVPQTVRHAQPSTWDHGICVTTESGRTLTMSPNHKIWASSPELEGDEKIIYLMYRPDMGFRVGITNKCEAKWNPYGARTSSERAERLWILAVAKDHEAALLTEESFSLQYGVPTAVFNAEARGINQDRVNRLFEKFGHNGARILEELHLSFDLPNWLAASHYRATIVRRTIQMTAHGGKGTNVTMEWTGRDLDSKLEGITVSHMPGDRNRIRRQIADYRQALAFAENLRERTGANLRRRISTLEEPFPLITAGGLLTGMSVLVEDGDTVTPEKIVNIKHVPGCFIDLDVDDASNFFGGGILSHNSIYQFRGASPELFRSLDQEGFKTGFMRTNRRCLPEIVEAANRLIAHNPDQLMEQVPLPDKPHGKAHIDVAVPPTGADAAIRFAEKVKAAQLRGEPMEDFAVLSRTNAELHDFETACIIRGIPFVRKGADSFLGSPEAKTFMAYLDLASSNDPKKLQAGLAEGLWQSGKLFLPAGSKPETMENAIDTAIDRHCSRERLNPKTYDPLVGLIRDARFRDQLAAAIRGSRVGDMEDWKLRNDGDVLQDFAESIIDLRTKASSYGESGPTTDDTKPRYTTKDMFDDILTFPVYERVLNDVTKKWESKQVTLKDKIVKTLKFMELSKDEDEAPVEEETGDEPLGTIGFFLEMLKPDPMEPDIDPQNPVDFRRRIDRYKERAKELRYDPDDWQKQHGLGSKPPGVYLGTSHCSPPDEPVLTTSGYVSIGDLDPTRHGLPSYQKSCNQLFWGASAGPKVEGLSDRVSGYDFIKDSRPYSGDLITITTAKSRTRVTPDHRMLVKFTPNYFGTYVVYLMRRGDWWRIGTTVNVRRKTSWVSLATRLAREKATSGWVLGVYTSKTEAIMEELRLQSLYGLPGLTFESSDDRLLTVEHLASVHDSLKAETGPRARRLLADFGLQEDSPFYRSGIEANKDGRANNFQQSFLVKACNFLSGYMEVPTVTEAFVNLTGPRSTWCKPEWLVATATREHYEGPVYSLSVIPHRYYISGGAVVHNSTKGSEWKDVTVLMAKGRFPMQYRGAPDRDHECPEVPLISPEEEMEGERRLGYVALTRAIENLTVLCPKDAVLRGKQLPHPPSDEEALSDFVKEAGLHIGENVVGSTPGYLPEPAMEGTIEDTGLVEETPSDVKTAYDYNRGGFVACDCGDDPLGPAPEEADVWRDA